MDTYLLQTNYTLIDKSTDKQGFNSIYMMIFRIRGSKEQIDSFQE